MGRISFTTTPMSSGAFKEVFKAEVTEGPYEGFPRRTACVIKAMSIKSTAMGHELTHIDIEMQDEAVNLCEYFNRIVQPTKEWKSCKAHMRVAKLSRMDGKKSLSLSGRLSGTSFGDGEAFVIEQKINGEFEKFNSNSGWSCGTCCLPDALSHWSWVHTQGDMLLCDPQGHRGRPGGPKCDGNVHYYLFTDPVVMTPTGRFGCTDLGQAGIEAFFKRHTCNSLCKALGLGGNKPSGSGGDTACQRGSLLRRK